MLARRQGNQPCTNTPPLQTLEKGFDVLFHLPHEIPQTLPALELTTKLNGVPVSEGQEGREPASLVRQQAWAHS